MQLSFVVPAPLAGCAAWAQSFTGSLTAAVTGPDGGVLAGAAVKVKDEARRFERGAVAGTTGTVVFSSLPPSSYRVSAEAPGYLVPELAPVALNVNTEALIRIELVPARRRDSVTVTAEAISVVTEAPAVRTVVDRQF